MERRYDKHFLSKLTDADGEQFETQHRVGTALECEYVNELQAKVLIDMCAEVGRLLGGMMAKADLFCGESYKVSRESPAEYFVNSTDKTDH